MCALFGAVCISEPKMNGTLMYPEGDALTQLMSPTVMFRPSGEGVYVDKYQSGEVRGNVEYRCNAKGYLVPIGPVEGFYPDGQRWYTGCLDQEGRATGVWQCWWPNRALKFWEVWDVGVRCGESVHYYSSGQKEIEATFQGDNDWYSILDRISMWTSEGDEKSARDYMAVLMFVFGGDPMNNLSASRPYN